MKIATYVQWFKAASSWCNGIPLAICVFLSFVGTQIIRTVYDFALADWTEELSKEKFHIFIVFAALTGIFASWRTILFIFCGISASRNFHKSIFAAVLTAPINLFLM